MKKTLALILAALMLAASLASCASVSPARLSPNVRLTSSDAESAAAWLEARLGEALTDRVVLGTSADGYGVDLSTLEKDGYVIRALGDEVALFARTAKGLDGAVRRYARAIENGTPLEDVTYHDGYRIKRLTIAGNDISEYAVVIADASSTCLSTAAGELRNFIESSCGTRVPLYNESEYEAAAEKPRRIVLTEGDESLGDEGFTITVGEDGTLTINGGKWRGALYGVWDFIEENLGWRFLGGRFIPSDRQEYLYESDHLDLTSSINRTETPDIPIIRAGGSGPIRLKHTYALDTNKSAFGSYGWARATCHGLQSNHSKIFSGEYEGLYLGCYTTGRQPCFTDEDILEAIDHYALEYVRERLDAGQEIGRELTCVDLGHWDAMWYSFCDCKECQKVEREEGGEHSGPVVRMGNRVCALYDEFYPGMCASIFGYCGTNKPCKTHPAHNLYVSYCYHVSSDWQSCQNHSLSGKECDPAMYQSNYTAAKELEGWAKIMDPAMLQIWMYPSNVGPYTFNAPLYRNALKDCRYLASLGVGQLFIDSQWLDNGLVNEELTMYLYLHFAWECDVTEEEELSMIREWFELVYGKDSGDLLYEIAMLAEQAGDRVGCWSALAGCASFDTEFVSKYAEQICEYCDRALALAESAEAEALIEKCVAGYRYMVILSRYDDMYINGDAASRESVTALYREVWDAFKKYNMPIHGGIGSDKWVFLPDGPFDPDVHPRRWIEDYGEEDLPS